MMAYIRPRFVLFQIQQLKPHEGPFRKGSKQSFLHLGDSPYMLGLQLPDFSHCANADTGVNTDSALYVYL